MPSGVLHNDEELMSFWINPLKDEIDFCDYLSEPLPKIFDPDQFDSDQWIDKSFDIEKLEDQLPRKKEEIENLINSARWILSLEDDWDDEGSQGYTMDTWLRAINFLKKQLEVLKDDFCCHPTPLPQIAPANKGSIDLSWELTDRQLLVNIPSDPSRLATYFGENDIGETTSGRLNIDRQNFALAMWLSCEI
jgi:hypothetical protein